MKSRIALFCAALLGSAVLWGCAPKATTTYDVARNLHDSKQYKEAIAKYEEYIKANPTSVLVPFSLFNEGACYEMVYDKANAMECYKKAVQQYPQTDPGQWAKAAMEDLDKRTLVAPTTTTTTMKPKPTTTTTMKPTTTTAKPKPTTTTTMKPKPTTTTAKPVTTTTLPAVPK